MIAAIELAILARLRAASDADLLGYRYRSLETYPAEFENALNEVVSNAPAAWTRFIGWRPRSSDSDRARFDATFGLIVCAKNVRNEQATRHGFVQGGGVGANEPGSYQMIEDACALLAGQALGLDIGVLTIGSLVHLRPPAALAKQKVSMMAVEMATIISIDPGTFISDLGDFETVHLNWDVPPHRAAPPLPDDARSDAIDHLTLETAI